MAYVQVDPSAITSTGSATADVPVGSLTIVDGKIYRYVYFDNGTAVASVAGGLAYYYDMDSYTVTMDHTYASSLQNAVAGIFQSVLTDTYYGWILVRGEYNLWTDGGGDIAKGDWVIAKAASGGTYDGMVDRVAAGTPSTNRPVGVATVDDSSTRVTCFVNLV